MAPKSRAIRARTAGVCPRMPASSLGVWVTDSMLLRALDHYQRATAIPVRRINSHMGPLESRRRANKRHMTGVMPTSSHAYPPIWQFDVGPSMLQWEAPTSKAQRKHRREQMSLSGLFNSLVGLLDGADKPFITPPGQLAAATINAEALAMNPECEPASVTEAPTSLELGRHLPEEVALLRSSICGLPTVDDSALDRIVSTCRKSLRRRIQVAGMSSEALVASMAPLDWACIARMPTPDAAAKLTAKIQRSILQALIDTNHEGTAPQDLWLTFVKEVLPHDGESHDITIVCRLLSNLPASVMADTPIEGLQTFVRNFISRQASMRNRFSNWASRAMRVSRSLQRLSRLQQKEVDLDMEKFLEQQDLVADTAGRLRFSWLIVKAQTRGLTTADFVALCRKTLASTQLNGLQVWQLSVARLSACAAMDDASCRQLAEAKYTSMRERWNALVTAAMSHDGGGVRELCAALHELGELGGVTRTMTPRSSTAQDMTAKLASGCSDHRQMLEMYEATNHRWDYTVWTKHVEAMIKDPGLNTLRIWQVLDLQRGTGSNEAKTELIDEMGVWFTQARHLTERQVLRQVQRCVDHQKRLTGGAVSPATLATLAEVVTRDLQRGKRGRTSRMEWLVDMVGHSQGRDEARDVATALKGWRRRVDSDNGR